MNLLYNNENKIALQTNEIISSYDVSKREKVKKSNELFHLLVYLECANLKNYSVLPNEPGDFILMDEDSNNIMVEITTCFGASEHYKIINGNLNKIFNRENKYDFNNELHFQQIKMKKLFCIR